MYTITYEAVSSKQPAYLYSLLTHARQSRQLQLSNSNLLFVPSVKTNVGARAFSVLELGSPKDFSGTEVFYILYYYYIDKL